MIPRPNLKWARPLAMAMAMVLLLPLVSMIVPVFEHANVQALPPAMGDWFVNSDESLSDADIILTGNLTIVFGGKLTLDNVTIRMNCTFNGQFNISVRTGGTFTMRNSTVAPIDFLQRFRYNFNVGIGSTADIIDSQLIAIGEGNLTRPNTLGLYVESSDVRLINNVFTRINILYMATAIGIGPLASPTIIGNEISALYPSGITAILGSKSLIKDNDIAASGIGITCLSSSPRIVSNDISSNLIGVQLTSSDVEMERNLISQNLYAGINANASEIHLYKDQFVDNVNDIIMNVTGLEARRIETSGGTNGIEIENGGSKAIRFINSSLSSNGDNDLTINNSKVRMLNTEFERDRVALLSNNTELFVEWYLNVSVSYVSGAPAIGATVSVEDIDNLTVHQGLTNDNGAMKWLEVEEYHQVGDNVTERTPHEVIASKAQITSKVEVVIDRSLDLEIELDDVPPVVNINEPTEGLMSNSSVVEFKGNATDNGQISIVEYRLKGASWYLANGTDEWNFTLSLQDGSHHLTVRATDLGGNKGSSEINVSVDTLAPVLSIMDPKDGALLNASPVQVEGKTEPGADLRLEGSNESIAVETNGDFSFLFDLTEGENVITLVAIDAAGNEVERTITVTLDTVPPKLILTSPTDGLITNSSTVTIKGWTDTDGTVTVNGLPIMLDTTGNFTHSLLLSDGNYTFTIISKDLAGNMVILTRTVIVDTIAPGLDITVPENGLLTNKTLIAVKGRAQTDIVHINQMVAEPVPDPTAGWWLIDELYPLDEGVNELVIEAKDEAGNMEVIKLTVTLDTTPPTLTVTEPEDGHKTRKKQVNIIGTTEPGATLSIGGQLVTDTDGTFSVPYNLVKGENTVTITATDDAGNEASKTIKVIRQEMEHETTSLGDNYGLVLVLIIFLVVVVFLLFYNFAVGRRSREKEEQEVEEELEMDEPEDLDEDKLEELKALDGDEEELDGLPPGPPPERSTLVLGGQHIEPASWRDTSVQDFSKPMEMDLKEEVKEEERPRPKKRSEKETFKKTKMKKVTKKKGKKRTKKD